MNPSPEIDPALAVRKPAAACYEARELIAKTLFCCPEFAQLDFRTMDPEDWKIHASRAWETAGVFIEEMKRHAFGQKLGDRGADETSKKRGKGVRT